MKCSKLIAITLTVSMLAACSEPDGSPGRGIENDGALSKSNVGTAAGVVAGGVIGSTIGAGVGQTLAIVGGGLLGGILGNSIGKSLDNADRAAYDKASQDALTSGQSRKWRNSDSGHSGIVIPHKTYRNADGQDCRKYTQTIYIDGKKHKGRGTACLEDDGVWRIIE